jgi:simple sugar transport system ATP-binding protein
MPPILEIRNATKEYRGVPAVRDVSFALERGEVHAILGENGAGKSTLTKMLAGVIPPSSGELFLDGKPIVLANPADALRHGIAMVYQETRVKTH